MRQYFDQIRPGRSSPRRFRYCPYCGNELEVRDVAKCATCGFTEYHNPLPGVSVLITDSENRVLVGRRRASPELWCLPCGFIEFGENFLQAAHREVMEETGLEIRIRSVVNVVSNIVSKSLESLVVVMHAEACGDRAIAGDDMIELRWISHRNIPDLAFDADRFLISEYYKTSLVGIPVDPRFSTSGEMSASDTRNLDGR